jgi:hypothetical protein
LIITALFCNGISGIYSPNFVIRKNSGFYNYLENLWTEAYLPNKGFSINYINNNGDVSVVVSKDVTFSDISETETDLIEKIKIYIYEPVYVSINDIRFAVDSSNGNIQPNTTITNGITKPTDKTKTLYKQYLKVLLPKVAQFVKEDDKKLNDKLSSFDSYIKDPEVKLAVYKSFQVIYENYLHGLQEKDFTFTVSNNLEESSFAFVDRGYNDISGLNGSSPGCILDIKTLLNDVNDYEVSLFSSMARLLSDNNFWFYPFQSFLTTTKNYNELFKINFDTPTSGDSKFVAMYVGGLSSNPDGPSTSSLQNDGIKKDAIPADLHKKNGVLNAFKVKFTGIQNQMVFSNLQVSTESLKNTDEGLRIQSEIVANGSNSYSIPKGQSLLNVYQKQSYSSTIKIPFGNMGIQPTQYFYQESMPLFDGLYIVYNVSHSIDADNQRLETTFKGYRLKRDVNPIVEQEFVDYLSKDIYTQGLNDLGVTGNILLGNGIVCGRASSLNVDQIYPKTVKRGGKQAVICLITNPPTLIIDLNKQPEKQFVRTIYTEKQVIDAADALVDKITPNSTKENKKRIVAATLAIGIKEQGLKGFNNNLTGVEASGFKVFAESDVDGKVKAREGGTGLIKTYYSFTSLSSGLIPLVSKIIERNMFAQDDDPNQFAWRYFRDWNGYGGRTTPEYQTGKESDCTIIKSAEQIYKRALNSVNQNSKFA